MKKKHWILGGVLWLMLQQGWAQNNVDLSGIKGQLKEKLAAKPFEINGGVQVNGVTNWGTSANQQPFSYVLAGNVLLKIYGYDMPFTFNYSNRKFSNTNPSFTFNRTAFNPKYKNWQGHFGNISMTFSPYTMAGFQFAGLGFTHQGQKWLGQVFYGRFLKAVPQDTTSQVTPSYRRVGMGIRGQYTHNKYKLGTALFYAMENPLSIPLPTLPTPLAAIKPMENLAINVDIGMPIGTKMSLETSISTSVLTTNRLQTEAAPQQGDALRSLLKSNNATTKVFYAIKSALNYTISKNDQIGINYERVDPNYHTLGGYFFTNDFENVTINAQHRGKVNVSLNTGIQRDDIQDRKQRNTGRMVVSSNIGFKLAEQTNLTFSYSNFQSYAFIRTGFERINQLSPFDNLDTLGFSQLSQNVNVGIQHTIRQDSLHVQQVMGNVTHMTLANKKGNLATTVGDNNVVTTVLNYNHTLVKRDLTLGIGLNHAVNRLDSTTTNTFGPTLNVAKQLFEKKLALNSVVSYNFTDRPAQQVLTVNVGASSTLQKVHSLNLTATWQLRTKPFNMQWTVNAGYTYTFQNYAPKIKFLDNLFKKYTDKPKEETSPTEKKEKSN
jgi:hypothetical protein